MRQLSLTVFALVLFVVSCGGSTPGRASQPRQDIETPPGAPAATLVPGAPFGGAPAATPAARLGETPVSPTTDSDHPVSSSDPTPPITPRPDLGAIAGVVRDANGKPLADAALGLVSGPGPMIEIAVLTNDKGEYSWPGLQPGKWTLSAHKDGFKSQERSVDVKAGATVTLDFSLAPN